VDDPADPASTILLGNLIAIAVLLLTSAFFSGSEIGFLAVGRARLRELSEQGWWVARVLLFMHERRTWVLATILVGITGSNYFAEHFATELGISYLGPTVGPLVAFVAITAVVLVFCEVLPIQFALRHPERIALWAALPITIVSVLLSPLVAAASTAARALLWLVGGRMTNLRPSLTEEQLRAMIDRGEEVGSIPAGQREILHSVLDFGDQTVAEVMTPRVDMVCISEDEPLSEALKLGVEHKHSRLPVYKGTLDDITGILFLKDLLPYLRSNQMDIPCRMTARAPYHVPENLPVDQLLRQMQSQRQMMAIVKDDFGGTAGLVTIEDVLEEIVGEIQDEYDTEEPPIRPVGPKELLCEAGITLRALQEHVSEQLPVHEHDTLGGLIMDICGHIPQAGEQLTWGKLEFIVEQMDGPRIKRVRVKDHATELPDTASG